MAATDGDLPLRLADVLAEEAIAVHGVEMDGGTGLYARLNALHGAALCLSGGGIRSASFALGVVQALAGRSLPAGARATAAERSILSQFHYLSTVSGGGYCGGWLSAWLERTSDFPKVWADLTGRSGNPDVEPGPILWLRSNSNYLTPKLGLTSADTWAALAIVLRNLLLNWFVLLPVALLAILGLKLMLAATAYVARMPQGWYWPSLALLTVGVLLLVLSIRFNTRNRPSSDTDRSDQRRFLTGSVAPNAISALCLCLATATPFAFALLDRRSTGDLLGLGVLAGVLVYCLGWLVAWPTRCSLLDFGLWAASGAVFGTLLTTGACLYVRAAGSPLSNGNPDLSVLWPFRLPVVLLLVCGMPWVAVAQLVAEMLFVGMSSFERRSDGDREWFGRAGGWLLAVTIGWLAMSFLVLVGSDLAGEVLPRIKSAVLAAGGISGLVTAALGASRWSPAKGAAKGFKAVSINLVLAIAAPVFVAALVIALSWMLDALMFGGALSSAPLMLPQVTLEGWPDPSGLGTIAVWMAAVAAIGMIAWKAVNINRFSLHALYRNRLIRAFLGASNRPAGNVPADFDPFTGFAESDNLRMHELWSLGRPAPSVGTAEWRPFHVINMALNIASTRRLAWQERKAEPFTVSPLHSGSSCKAYRRSADYGDPEGISLGTAVAVSGAAVSPNMGYHSSAPLSLLLAFFNVRLGWWLGNPGEEGSGTYRDTGPRTAITPFLREVCGLTTDTYRYVYLSDGGHFENLGVYEMVRRRCGVILVSDAGEDGSFAFEDLGNAVRKIALDLGVPIRFEGLERLSGRAPDGSPPAPGACRFALAEIDYASADGGGANGLLVYIKPSYFGREGAGVRSYASAHPDFPHQSTGNQWFSESQMESYRALGFEIMEEVLAKAAANLGQPATGLKDFFEALRTP